MLSPEVAWLPPREARTYGRLGRSTAPLGLDPPASGRVPLLLHPQRTAAQRRLVLRHGAERLGHVAATPTSSWRTVLAWSGRAAPAMLKLSLGAFVGRSRRALREDQIARGTFLTALLSTIPRHHRRELGIDWFGEPAGVVAKDGAHGWVVRTLPSRLRSTRGGLTPGFSLLSRRGTAPPDLVRMIRDSGERPEGFVVGRVLAPYVNALAYLLLEEGIQTEAHSQNVLYGMNDDGELDGTIVFRDLSDTTFSATLRLAKRRPCITFEPGFFPRGAPFPIVSICADYRNNFQRPRMLRTGDPVERYGLLGWVWPLNRSLERYYPSYDAAAVEQAYLLLWQQASVVYLRARPLLRPGGSGLALDEAMVHFFRHTDWHALGATEAARLPLRAEPLMLEGRARRRPGRVYRRLESAWGDLFLRGPLPEFFRPAF